MIIFDQVTKQFGSSTALEDISLRIEPGEFVFIQGPSGAGKTTLARLLIRELLPTSGSIQVGDFLLSDMKKREIPILRRQIGVVFQDYKLIPDRTAAENIGMALEIVGKSNAVVTATVEELLKVTGLEGKGNQFPRELSGGEVQRVVIARALATEPAVIFADEPTGNLDEQTGLQILELLERINEEGTAVIAATHSQSLIDAKDARVIQIREGRVVEDSQPKQTTKESKASSKDTPSPAKKDVKSGKAKSDESDADELDTLPHPENDEVVKNQKESS